MKPKSERNKDAVQEIERAKTEGWWAGLCAGQTYSGDVVDFILIEAFARGVREARGRTEPLFRVELITGEGATDA